MAFKAQKNITEEQLVTSKDKQVVFDENKHVYHYDGETLLSTTTFIKRFTKPFNSLFPSIAKAKKNTRVKNGIKDPVKLRLYWRLGGQRASGLGTASHIFAEMYMIDRTTVPKTGYEKAIIKAINKLEEKWEIIAQEEIVYSAEYMIAGSIDLVLRNKKTGEYALGDWKTTEDMYKNYNKMLDPFNIPDSALNKYSIQLDVYSVLYYHRIPEKNRIIIQLKPDGKCIFYTPNSRTKELRIPYTADKTMKALKQYKQQNIK